MVSPLLYTYSVPCTLADVTDGLTFVQFHVFVEPDERTDEGVNWVRTLCPDLHEGARVRLPLPLLWMTQVDAVV
jgi:hypothetical protein